MMKRLLRLWFLRSLALLARPFARRQPAAVASVLLIKPDHLGDVLLATPALAALRLRLPNAEISALVGPWASMLLARNPDVDHLLECPFPGFERRPPAGHGGAAEQQHNAGPWPRLAFFLSAYRDMLRSLARPYLLLLRYAALLRAARYDAAIIARDDHWWGAALALLAGIPLRAGFAVPECRPFLSFALPWNPRDHVAAQALALAEAVAAAPAGQPTPAGRAHARASVAARFDPAPADEAWAGEWLDARDIGTADLVVVHPGTAGPDKLWLAERWAAVADALANDGARLVLTGGPGEEGLVDAVAAAMRTPAITLAGQTSIGQLAALLRRAGLVLGVDSGPLHLAAAQGTPTVHLYGPGDAGRFGPWGDPQRHVVIREALWCSPCGVFSACPRGLAEPECMQLIAAARVLQAARQLRAQHRS